VRRAEIGLSILRRYMPEAKASPKAKTPPASKEKEA
jgi:hypothetical protein